MVRIEIRKKTCIEGRDYKPGDVVMVPDRIAEGLIACGTGVEPGSPPAAERSSRHVGPGGYETAAIR